MDRAKGTPAGLWQRSDQAPVFYVIAMKDNKDEQVNYTHINNCFNQTISEFVFCKRAATDVLLRSGIVDPTTAVKAFVWINGILLCKIDFNRNLSF